MFLNVLLHVGTVQEPPDSADGHVTCFWKLPLRRVTELTSSELNSDVEVFYVGRRQQVTFSFVVCKSSRVGGERLCDPGDE